MNKMITIVVLAFSSMLMAQNRSDIDLLDQENLFKINWQVVDTDVAEKFIVLKPIIKEKGLEQYNRIKDQLKPVCFNELDQIMVFKYAMLGMDNAFYDGNSQAVDISKASRFPYSGKQFKIRIEVEAEGGVSGKICTENKAQRFFANTSNNNKNSFPKYGIISYLGDKDINPPF
jgi:hypothetical protein